MKLLPKSLPGKWAVGLSLAFIILMAVKILSFLPLPTFAIAALGLAGFMVGIWAVFKNKDRVLLIIIPMLVGIVIILWTAAEFIFPH
jgi:hypothetical protein